jgi:hypothetical protein
MTKIGRPLLIRAKCYCGIRAEKINSDITFFLDTVMSWCYSWLVKFPDREIEPCLRIEDQMRSRLRHEYEQMRAAEKRMKDLESCYNEYIDLRDETAKRRERLLRILALVGFHSVPGDDATLEPAAAAFTSSEKELRANLPLWEAMQEYLSHVKEARITEMENFFDSRGFHEGNRQAMESALKRHPEVFRTRKSKREKYISLR